MAETANTTTQLVRRILVKAPLFFAALLALTGCLLLWQHYGMERVVELSARSGHEYIPASDSEAGGASTAQLVRQDDALRLRCRLIKQFAWPYCKITFTLGVETQGIDLSRFDYLTLDASTAGPGDDKLRLWVVNFEEGFSVPKVWLTNKVNEVDPFDMPADGRITIPIDLFHTAVWWKDQAKPPLSRTNVRIDNATYLIVQTGPDAALGEHEIVLRSVRFHGKAISRAELLMGLVGLWIVSAIGWPLAMYVVLKTELHHSKAEIQLLAEVNRALRLETQELAGQVHLDPLTGVLNRQGLRAHLMQSSTLLTPPMSLIFLDIDHFKSVNDTHGHQVGDLVLQQFAATVAATIRSNDKLVRWGGEEFLLLCPLTDASQAAALAEKLRVVILQSSWPNGLRVTASFGVAQHRIGEEIGQVIERADAELYSAKADGRNRVHTHGMARQELA